MLQRSHQMAEKQQEKSGCLWDLARFIQFLLFSLPLRRVQTLKFMGKEPTVHSVLLPIFSACTSNSENHCYPSEPMILFAISEIIECFLVNFQSQSRWLSWLKHHLIHQKVMGFDSWLGHIPRVRVKSLVRVCLGESQLMFLSKVNKHILG